MSQEFHAIYEHGVLRPLTPLNLPESIEVTGTVQPKNGLDAEGAQPSTADLRTQQDALNAMFQAVEKLPQISHNDGLSGRDHDLILYGPRT
jgi:predicted DNA-binding antitoxin AbrB/MazE fold protein